jgi:hypothetical protein
MCPNGLWLSKNCLTVEVIVRQVDIGSTDTPWLVLAVGNQMPHGSPLEYADLVILSDDPTTVAVGSLLDIQVVATMVGGRVEHCIDTALC